MLYSKKMLLVVALAALMAVTWLLTATNSTRASARQASLIGEAVLLMQDKIYVKAIPLLQEAETAKPDSVEATKLMVECYNGLGNKSGAISAMKAAIERGVADEQMYAEVAQSYLYGGNFKDGLQLLKDGVEQTNSVMLGELYEQERYRYSKSYEVFEEMGSYANGFVAAKSDGKWGYITPDGDTGIPFTFDRATAFEKGYSVAMDNGVAVLIDKNGYRNQLCKETVTDILPLSGGIAGLMIDGKWHMTSKEMTPGKTAFDFIGTINENRRATAKGGRWILYNEKNETATTEFDEIKTDRDGNAFAMGRAFAKQGGQYILIDGSGNRVGTDSYEDAKPFADGWAAVKKDGKWHFITETGAVAMTGEWDEIASFSCGVAAVRYNGKWGYLSVSGKLVIENLYAEATDFKNGVATVNTDGGWCMMQLKEYMD